VIQDASAITDPGAKAIVHACHEAWRRRLGQLSEEVKRGRFEFATLVERERERWRVALVGCRNLAALRATLTNFWARAGAPIPVLQEHWQEILPYLTEMRWQEARDLALLALVSYARDEAPAETGAERQTAPDGEEAGA
jgi:CRISPR-associated protein Cas8a1/Csx13